MTRARLICAFLLSFLLRGCTTGSMLVEVEVYDGPLARQLDAQVAELVGTNKLTAKVLETLVREFHLSQCRLGCFGKETKAAKDLCGVYIEGDENPPSAPPQSARLNEDELNKALFSRPNANTKQSVASMLPKHVQDHLYRQMLTRSPTLFEDIFDKKTDNDRLLRLSKEDDPVRMCPVLADIKLNMSDVLLKMVLYQLAEKTNEEDASLVPLRVLDDIVNRGRGPSGSITEANKKIIRDYAIKTAEVGRLLREGAEQWASAQIAIMLRSRRARIIIARAGIAAAELGNEISGRADAIIKQLDGINGQQLLRQELATSTFLREAEGTDYLNLVEWLNAYPREEPGWDRPDRTRMIERLITDANWSHVNTVFAKGHGDVGMVFVKDDIGNWNLKNYKNDPSELLKSYVNFGSAVAGTAIKLAGSGEFGTFANKVSEAAQGINTANQVTYGVGSTAQTQQTTDRLKQQMAARLAAVVTETESRNAKLEEDINAAKAEVQEKAATEQQTMAELEKARSDYQTAVAHPDLVPADQTPQNVHDAWARLQEVQEKHSASRQALTASEGKLASLEAEQKQLPHQLLDRSREILRSHDAILESMEQAATEQASPIKPAATTAGASPAPSQALVK